MMILMLTLLSCIVFMAAAPDRPAGGPNIAPSLVAQHGRLQAKGNRIVGKHGRPVSLAGNSFFWSQWMPQYYTPGVVKWLKDDWKSGVVRVAVGIAQGGYLENPDAETARVSTVIDAAIKEGLYVIIDWHDHHAHQHEAQATAFFQKMARKYGHQPNVIYEIFNEPMKISWAEQVKPYSERVISAIRAIDRDNLILVGSPTWSQDVDVAAEDPIKDPNVAYTLHFYAGTHKQYLRDKADKALSQAVALFVSEWGTCDANGDGKVAVESTNEWMEWMRKNQISHLNWSVADKVEAASIIKPKASTEGKWKPEDLTESGRFVREIVRTWGAEK